MPLNTLKRTETESLGGYSTRGRIICFAITGRKLKVHLGEGPFGVALEKIRRLAVEYQASILGEADHVNRNSGNAVPLASKLLRLPGRPLERDA